VLRIGYTATNVPDPTFFEGRISEVRFFNSALEREEVQDWAIGSPAVGTEPSGYWNLDLNIDGKVQDETKGGHHLSVLEGSSSNSSAGEAGITVAGVEGQVNGMHWDSSNGDLRLHIPAGKDDRLFTLWFASSQDLNNAKTMANEVVIDIPARDLTPKTKGGPSRWAQVLTA
jgi:hypothetical protein